MLLARTTHNPLTLPHKALTGCHDRFMASPRRVSPPRRHPGFALAFAVVAACGEPDVAPPDLSALPPLPEAVTVADAARGAERPMRELAIALVGEVRAEIEPCGCPTLPYGGFARREALLTELRSSARPLLHLDAGELLLKGQTTTRAEAKKRRAELLLELSVDVGVDAWAPGPSDLLALGVEGLDALRSGALVAPCGLGDLGGRVGRPAPAPAGRRGGRPSSRRDRDVGAPAGPWCATWCARGPWRRLPGALWRPCRRASTWWCAGGAGRRGGRGLAAAVPVDRC